MVSGTSAKCSSSSSKSSAACLGFAVRAKMPATGTSRIRALASFSPTSAGGDAPGNLGDDGALAHAGIAGEQRRLAVQLEQRDDLGDGLVQAMCGAELAVAGERGEVALDELLQFVLASTLVLLLGHGAGMIRGSICLCPR